MSTSMHVSCTCGDCDECSLRAELLEWGQAHNWPRLMLKPWLAIAEGQNYWQRYTVTHPAHDLHDAVSATANV